MYGGAAAVDAHEVGHLEQPRQPGLRRRLQGCHCRALDPGAYGGNKKKFRKNKWEKLIAELKHNYKKYILNKISKTLKVAMSIWQKGIVKFLFF